ncbi:MAG: hypothetical protein LBS91_07265 [Clostridiales Family XIII bacterium]|nr:hypothetical protein [Clostridiales Family XIII bacterium]
MEDVQNIAKELGGLLRELLAHARTEGKNIEGGLSAYLARASAELGSLVSALETDARAVAHGAPLHQLAELRARMGEQVEHSEPLKSFWERMAEEIPDMLEGVEAFLEKGEEAAASYAGVIEELAAEL